MSKVKKIEEEILELKKLPQTAVVQVQISAKEKELREAIAFQKTVKNRMLKTN